MVCAIPRKDPIIPYFLLEDQPLKKRGYLPSLRRTSNNTLLTSSLILLEVRGQVYHNSRAKVIEAIGEPKNTIVLLAMGTVTSFKKSLTASAIGCSSPPIETFQGPFRYCIRPKIFRSIKVTKATLIKIGKMVTIKLNNAKKLKY